MSRDTIATLERLQTIDIDIEALTKQADTGPARIGDLESQVAKARLAADQERGRLADNERARRHLENQLTDDREKAKKWESRLPQLKHPREFAALEREVEGLKKSNAAAEEELARLTLDAEPVKAALRVKEGELAEREAALAKEAGSLKRNENKLRNQIAELQASRDEARKHVDPRMYATYEQIRKRRGGRVIVTMVNETCSGCNRRLAPQTANRLRSGAIESCPACLRIVHSPPPPPEATLT